MDKELYRKYTRFHFAATQARLIEQRSYVKSDEALFIIISELAHTIGIDIAYALHNNLALRKDIDTIIQRSIEVGISMGVETLQVTSKPRGDD